MGSGNEKNVIAIFYEALEKKSSEDLNAYLSKACGNDEFLRERVVRLLSAHSKTQGSFLESPASLLEATIDVEPDSMDTGVTAIFQNVDTVVGSSGHSVMQSLKEQLGKDPSINLLDAQNDSNPAENTNSREIPKNKNDKRYQLHGEIARGGMGAIIKGRDTDLGRDVAVKVLLDAHKVKPDYIERFVEEAQIGGQLQHPGIVPVYELGQFEDRRPFFTMKLVKGQTLASLLTKRKSPEDDLPKLLGVFEQICQTMAYAHSKGVIHRDLKPANVMVGSFGEVQVMDWGLSKVLSIGGVVDEKKSLQKHRDETVIHTRRSAGSDALGSATDVSDVGSNTCHGSIMGTPAYMPPEQALGEVELLDARADVFGLGALLAEILTGKPAYVAKNASQVLRMATRGKLDDCFERLQKSGADDELIDIAKKALAPEVEDRLADAGELSQLVTEYLEGVQERLKRAELTAAESLVRIAEERRRRKLNLAIGLLVMLLAAGAFFLIDSQKRAQDLLERAELGVVANRVLRISQDVERSQKLFPMRNALLAAEAAKLASKFPSLKGLGIELLANSTIDLPGPPLRGHQDYVASLCFSSDGESILSGAHESTVRQWNVASAKQTSTFVLPDTESIYGRVQAVGYSRNGRWAVTGFNHDANTGRLHFWDTRKTKGAGPVREFDDYVPWFVQSQDRRLLATKHADKTIRIWDLEADDPTREFFVLGGAPDDWFEGWRERDLKNLRISPDNRWLIAFAPNSRKAGFSPSSQPQSVYAWDLVGIREERGRSSSIQPLVFKVEDGAYVTGIDFLADGDGILCSSSSGKITSWNFRTDLGSFEPKEFLDLEHEIERTDLSADGRWLAVRRVVSGSGNLTELWELENEHVVDRVPLLLGELDHLTFAPNGRWLAASQSNVCFIWDLQVEQPASSKMELKGHDGSITSLVFNPKSTRLATGSADRTLRIWDLENANPGSDRVLYGAGLEGAAAVHFTPDRKRVVACDQNGKIFLWAIGSNRVSSPVVLQGTDKPKGHNYLKMSPGGRWLAVPTNQNSVRIWDLNAKDIPGSMLDLNGDRFLAFGPADRWLASAAGSPAIQLWDLEDRDPASSVRLIRHADDPDQLISRSVAISPDAKWISCSFSSKDMPNPKYAIRFWDIEAVIQAPTASEIRPVKEFRGKLQLNASTFSADSSTWFGGGANYRNAFVIDMPTEDDDFQLHILDGSRHTNWIQRVAISETTNRAITQANGGRNPHLWELEKENYRFAKVLAGHDHGVATMALSRNEIHLVTTCSGGTARVWNLEDTDQSPLVLRVSGDNTQFLGADIGPEGRWVVTGHSNCLRLWDLDLDAQLERSRQLAGRELTEEELDRFLGGNNRQQ